MKKHQRYSFVKNAISYSGTNIVGQFITLIRGFLVRRILPPEIMGFWNLVGVIQGLMGTFDLGCSAGAIRELPIISGKGNWEEETKIRSTTLWFTFFQNIIISLFACGYVTWNFNSYGSWEIIAASVAVLMFIINGFYLSYVTFFSGALAFVPLSKVLLLSSIIEGVLFPASAYYCGLKGLMSIAVISSVFKLALFSSHSLWY